MDGRAIDVVAAAADGPFAPEAEPAGATWRSIVDTDPDGVLVLDADGRLLHATAAARTLLGLDANRLLAAYRGDYLGLAAQRPETPAGQVRHVLRADGRSLWVRFRPVELAAGPDGRPVRAVHVTDLTGPTGPGRPPGEAVDLGDGPRNADERWLGTLLRNLGETIVVFDARGRSVGSSGVVAGQTVLGYPPQAWAGGLELSELVDPADRARVGLAFRRLVRRPGGRIDGVVRVRAADGSCVEVEAGAVNLLHDPDVGGILVTARDVSSRARADTFTAGQAEILRQIAAAAPLESTMRALVELVDEHLGTGGVAVLPLGETGEGRSFSAAPLPPGRLESLVHAVGLPPAGEVRVVDGLEPLRAFPDLAAALRAEQVGRLAVVALGAPAAGSGATRPEPPGVLVWLMPEHTRPDTGAIAALRAAAELAAIAIERERAERDLAHLALHDVLTGLAIRHLLVDRLEQALNRAKRRGRRLALVFLDLDRFKTINDTLGHDVGDQLLRQFAERLRLLVRPEDTVARFGGDEFVVLVEHVIDEQEAAQIAERLEGSMNEPFQLDEQQLAVTASVGIVIGKGDDQPAALLRNADSAMYRAKELGRNRTEMYDTRLEAHLADRTRLGVDLRTALIEGHLHLVYQPIVDLRSGEMRMIEALLRWDHPDHGRLLPLDFLAAAEDSGQGLELGAWVIERALTDLARFARHPAWDGAPGWPRPPRLVVNLSARQLAHPELVARVELALVRHHFLPQNLAVDVSERALATAGEMALRNLDHLHRIGVGIALDDVGGGPSTALLNVLERVPADILKVDPSVIASMGLGERTPDDRRVSLQRSMAAGLLGLGRGLGLTVVAEGVDQPRRVQQLRQLGFDLAQGHAIGAPVEADRMVTLLPG